MCSGSCFKQESDDSTFAHSGLIRMAHFPSKTAFLWEKQKSNTKSCDRTFILHPKIASDDYKVKTLRYQVRQVSSFWDVWWWKTTTLTSVLLFKAFFNKHSSMPILASYSQLSVSVFQFSMFQDDGCCRNVCYLQIFLTADVTLGSVSIKDVIFRTRWIWIKRTFKAVKIHCTKPEFSQHRCDKSADQWYVWG